MCTHVLSLGLSETNCIKEKRNKAKLPIALETSCRRQKHCFQSSKEKLTSRDTVAAPLAKSLM